MHQLIQKNKMVLVGLATCLLIGSLTMSFQNTPFGPIGKLDSMIDQEDTIPEKTKEANAKMTIHDFDQLMPALDKEMLGMQKEISKIDFNRIHQEISASLNKVDFDKIKLDIDKAMKDIDMGKIEQGVQSALKEIDWDKTNIDVKISLQNAKTEIEKINMESVKKEMEKAKLEIEKSRKELKKINVDEIMKNATAGIANAKEELRLTKEMFNEMEKDGLINQKAGFTIEFKDKTLVINGRKQSEPVRDKYKQYIKGDSFKISIRKE